MPGGVEMLISRTGVFYPDKRTTQRVGIVPDMVTVPTLKGVREGCDEVLERAVRYILGRRASEKAVSESLRPESERGN